MLITDESCLPIWVARLHDRVTGEDIQGIRTFVERMHQAPTSFLLVDGRTARAPDATIRAELGKFAAAKHDDGRDRTLAVSILLPSGLLSGPCGRSCGLCPRWRRGSHGWPPTSTPPSRTSASAAQASSTTRWSSACARCWTRRPPRRPEPARWAGSPGERADLSGGPSEAIMRRQP